MTGEVVSPAIQLDQDFGYSVQAVWTGSPTGTLQLEASNDQVTWIPVYNSPVEIAAEDGKIMWNAWGTTAYAWARLHYLSTSGTGSLSARTFIRGF